MSNAQLEVSGMISNGEATYEDIADGLGVSKSTARDHIKSLRDGGEDISSYVNDDGRKVFYYRRNQNDHFRNKTKSYQESTRNKRQKTNRLNDHINDMEARLNDLLERSKPAIADGDVPLGESNEDVVIHRTDAHFGDQVEDEFGNVVFSPEILEEREKYITDKVMRLVERQNEAGVEYDTAHFLLGGDCVTGEHTYANQLGEVVLTLDEQVDMAFEVYMEQIKRLAARFPAVQVVCVPGNHGALEAKYSEGANVDRLLYMMMDEAIRSDPSLDNVTFIRTDSTKFTNFYVRGDKRGYEENDQGWRFHLRHGDDSLEHIGTSAGKKRWYQWLLKHKFDQAYRGHYHKFEIDTLHDDTEVVMTGSAKPPDDFEESISEWSQPSAYIHGTSDTMTKTWGYEVRFDK